MSQTLETQIGGRTLTIETGKLARLAGGAVTVRYGDTLVLGTATRRRPVAPPRQEVTSPCLTRSRRNSVVAR